MKIVTLTSSHLRFTIAPVPALAFVCAHQLLKQVAVVFTLFALVAMAYIPQVLFEATGSSSNFRYSLLIEIALVVGGVSCQLAVFTVLLKWTLAGVVECWSQNKACLNDQEPFRGGVDTPNRY